jgi:hypothetical protein
MGSTSVSASGKTNSLWQIGKTRPQTRHREIKEGAQFGGHEAVRRIDEADGL